MGWFGMTLWYGGKIRSGLVWPRGGGGGSGDQNCMWERMSGNSQSQPHVLWKAGSKWRMRKVLDGD